jgi:hypothetical protein
MVIWLVDVVFSISCPFFTPIKLLRLWRHDVSVSSRLILYTLYLACRVSCHIGKFILVAYLENLPIVSSLN